VLVALCVPGTVIAWEYLTGVHAAEPVKAIIKAAGLWTIRLLFVALAVTPLAQALRWPSLALVRRMIGVAAFAYAALHLAAFAADKMFDPAVVAREIALRIYLTIGMATWLVLAALAATSTDAAVRRMGRRWRTLHRAVYAAALLAVVHFFLQTRLDVSEPVVMAGFLIWLAAYRAMLWRAGPRRATAPEALALLAAGAGTLSALGEALYFHLRTGVPPLRLLEAHLTLATGLRPGWIVLGAGLAVAAATLGAHWKPRRATA
jgi:sulfoxide reductase heme-binding subunit YedZ